MAAATAPASRRQREQRHGRLSWVLGVAILAGGALRQRLLVHSYRFFVDDAYIFLRYARRATGGEGLTYNGAQHVLGFTSPLYVVILTGLGELGGAAHLAGEANAADLSFYLAASAILVGLARRHEASLPVLLIAWLAWFPLVAAGVNGMETMLFIALQYGALLLAVEGREGWAATVAALAVLTRPEGAIFAVVLVGGAVAHRRPTWRAWRASVVGVALLVVWAVFAVATYGTLLPQSIIAKGALQGTSGGVVEKLGVAAVGLSTSQYRALGPAVRGVVMALGVAALAAVVAGLVVDLRRRAVAAAVPAWFVLTWLFYVVGHPIQLWSWYSAPTTMAVWWTLARHGPGAIGRLANLLRGQRSGLLRQSPATSIRVGAVVMVGAVVVATAGSLAVGERQRERSLEASVVGLERLARVIQHQAPAAQSIFIDDIGIVGWTTGDHIVDGAGLVSPLGAVRHDDRLLSVDTLTRRTCIDVVALKADPALGAAIADPLLRRPIFDDAGQRADLLASYRETPAYGLGGYQVLLVRRALDSPRP
ncbi:MAG: hypothetical protein M3063_05130 [Actinomycetota bacterium]|nr:hypothetical protein [Actinomycetota bacterium]